MGKGYILVEGHGDIEAAHNLITRLAGRHARPSAWSSPIRWKNLHRPDGLVRGAEVIRSRGDAEALLILRDEDDACPKQVAPTMAATLRPLALPFPTALVLLRPEFEVLFLPCIAEMAGRPLGAGVLGRPGLRPGTAWTGDWERRRGIKEWLTENFPPDRSYKPAIDQLPMTRMIDLDRLRAAEVPCFGTLERGLDFLATHEGGVYP